MKLKYKYFSFCYSYFYYVVQKNVDIAIIISISDIATASLTEYYHKFKFSLIPFVRQCIFYIKKFRLKTEYLLLLLEPFERRLVKFSNFYK